MLLVYCCSASSCIGLAFDHLLLCICSDSHLNLYRLCFALIQPFFCLCPASVLLPSCFPSNFFSGSDLPSPYSFAVSVLLLVYFYPASVSVLICFFAASALLLPCCGTASSQFSFAFLLCIFFTSILLITIIRSAFVGFSSKPLCDFRFTLVLIMPCYRLVLLLALLFFFFLRYRCSNQTYLLNSSKLTADVKLLARSPITSAVFQYTFESETLKPPFR